MEIKWLGHACFKIDTGVHCLVIDPFIQDNPVSPVSLQTLHDVDWVLVTHGHSDHYSDACELAIQSNATLISNFEITEDASANGVETVDPMNIGGTIRNGPLRVHMTEAQHSSGAGLGHQCGYVIELEDNSIYHAGDTGLFSDMKLIGEFLDPQLGLVPIGDRFTMGPRSAAKAVEFLGLNQVIPMHYNTFEYIEQDPYEFKDYVDNQAEVVVLDPGNSHQVL